MGSIFCDAIVPIHQVPNSVNASYKATSNEEQTCPDHSQKSKKSHAVEKRALTCASSQVSQDGADRDDSAQNPESDDDEPNECNGSTYAEDKADDTRNDLILPNPETTDQQVGATILLLPVAQHQDASL